MNVENLNKLIARLETLRPDQFSMKHTRGSVCCITGWSHAFFGRGAASFLDYPECKSYDTLIMPKDWDATPSRYPLLRAIATLKRLRNTYLSTGKVVVDWGPEPGEEPKTPWVAPSVSEVIAPTLPAEITSLLRPSLAKTEA